MKDVADIFFESELLLAPGCPQEGTVQCQVTDTACHLLDCLDHVARVRVRFGLRITIVDGPNVCTFDRQAVFTGCVRVDCCNAGRCNVEKAECGCVLIGGRVFCCLSARLRFEKKGPCPPLPPAAGCNG